MSASKADIDQLAKKLRYDLTAAQAKLSDLMEIVASLPLPDDRPSEHVCRHCPGHQEFDSERRLLEHLENVHGHSVKS